jgi:hypothetical protein
LASVSGNIVAFSIERSVMLYLSTITHFQELVSAF